MIIIIIIIIIVIIIIIIVIINDGTCQSCSEIVFCYCPENNETLVSGE